MKHGTSNAYIAALALGSALLACCTLPASAAAAPATAFSWKLTNKFRLLTEEDETRFGKDFANYQANAHKGKFSVNPAYWQYAYARLTERNYKSAWDDSKAQYDLNYVQSKDRPALLNYKAPAKSACDWSINGAQLGKSDCTNVKATLKLGSNQIALKVDGKPVPIAPLLVDDYFAVVIGDSTASGEGNPQVGAIAATRTNQGKTSFVKPGSPAFWLDERCHRSLVSGPLIALFNKSKSDPHRSVTVIDYACSGAEIDNGIMDGPATKPYWGRETPAQVDNFFSSTNATEPNIYRKVMLPAQVSAVDEALCVTGGATNNCLRRSPDVVILVTGANELKFADVLTTLIEDCPNGSCFGLQAGYLSAAIGRLSEQFGRLHKRIQTWSPKKVLLVGYMDPTHDINGQLCDDNYLNWLSPHFVPPALGIIASLFHEHLGTKDSDFAEKNFVIPLNAKLAGIASSYQSDGWQFISNHIAGSKPHGYCSTQRWDLTYGEAASKQGVIKEEPSPDLSIQKTIGGVPSGAMHPNVFGHLAMARALAPALGK